MERRKVANFPDNCNCLGGPGQFIDPNMCTPDMQFVTKFTQTRFQNNFLPEKRVNYDNIRFPTKQRKLYFHIINSHSQGYITLNKYIICIASTRLPKVNLRATKYVTKRQ